MRFDIPDVARATSFLRFAFIASALMLAAATARAQDPVTPLPAPADTAVRPVGPVRPGDVLQLRFLGQEGISGDYIIDPEGVVTIPGIGSVRIAGMTPRKATEALDEIIKVRFSRPEFVANFRIRVFVLGPGVATPGPFVVEPGTTLLQMLAIAGGQTDRADLKRATVLREGRQYPINLEAGLSGSRVGEYPVFSNDQIIVPARGGFTRENVAFVLSLFGTALTLATLIVSLQRN
jgi:protein involved in polysaccharide export with SLBB domain